MLILTIPWVSVDDKSIFHTLSLLFCCPGQTFSPEFLTSLVYSHTDSMRIVLVNEVLDEISGNGAGVLDHFLAAPF